MESGPSGVSLKTTLSKLGKKGHYEKKMEKLTVSQLKELKNRAPLENISNAIKEGPQPFSPFSLSTEETTKINRCAIMQQERSNIAEDLTTSAKSEFEKSPEINFIFASQLDANDGKLSIMIENDGCFEIESSPLHKTFIQFISKDKHSGSGKSLGKQSLINKTQAVDCGIKLSSIRNIDDIFFGDSKPRLVQTYLPVDLMLGGGSTESEVKNFIRKVVKKVYGYELSFSSPTGMVKNNPMTTPPIINIYKFPLEKDKMDLISRLVQKKFNNNISDDSINFGEKDIKIPTLVTLIIRQEAEKIRANSIKYLKSKASEMGLDELGFHPEKKAKDNKKTGRKNIAKKNLNQSPTPVAIEKMVKKIIDLEVDVNASDEYGKSTLHWAASVNDVEAVETLIAHGANIDALDSYNETPLFLSCREGSYQASKALLDHCANRDITDHMNMLPKDVAQEKLHNDIVKLLDEHAPPAPLPHMFEVILPQKVNDPRPKKRSDTIEGSPIDDVQMSPPSISLIHEGMATLPKKRRLSAKRNNQDNIVAQSDQHSFYDDNIFGHMSDSNLGEMMQPGVMPSMRIIPIDRFHANFTYLNQGQLSPSNGITATPSSTLSSSSMDMDHIIVELESPDEPFSLDMIGTL